MWVRMNMYAERVRTYICTECNTRSLSLMRSKVHIDDLGYATMSPLTRMFLIPFTYNLTMGHQ